jgi:hypothetical protein
MSKAKIEHLKHITPKALRDFRDDENTFISFASSTGKNGLIQLGLNGKGNYCVIIKDKVEEHINILQAVDRYTELVS